MHTEPLAPPASPASDDVLAGTPYRTVRKLGRGGMGEVLEAEHVGLGKRVVVKLLRPELTGEPSLVERLRIEAQVMARLQHPHVASVHDLGTTPGGRPYFVLEYLEGCTVSEELRAHGPMPVPEAIRVVLDVLDGLGAAHEAGLVHRDVKGTNVFLCAPDRYGKRPVKLLDFGVVKVNAAREPRFFPTEAGHFIGSPAVAAPEQACGRAVDARADIYATGLLLYVLIAGKSPFNGATAPHAMLAAQVITVPPPLSSVTSQGVPVVLDMIVAKALAKDPGERYATAAQMAAALERVLAALPSSERLHGALPSPSRMGHERTEEMPKPACSGGRDVTPGAPAYGTLVIEPAARPALRGEAPAWLHATESRVKRGVRRVAPAALVAMVSGALFFALLWVVWRIVRGAS